MLARLAEMDMAIAEKAHGLAMAATDPAEFNGLARSYQRAARCLRQTLMMKVKRDKDHAQAAEYAERRKPVVNEETTYSRLIDGRIEDLRDAIGRIAAVTHPGNLKLQREALDRLDVELDDW